MKVSKAIILCIAFFIGSCNNGQRSFIDEIKTANEPPIAPILEKQVLRFIENVRTYDSVGKDNVYSLEFLIDSEYVSPPTADTIIILSSLGCNNDSIAYIGACLFYDYLVTIFDRNYLGSAFYDQKKLINIPIQYFRCEESEMRVAQVLIIKDKMLFEWH